MTEFQDYTLQNKQKNGDSIDIRKSYEITSLINLAEILSEKKKDLSLQIIDSSGIILWQNKSNPESGAAQLKGE